MKRLVLLLSLIGCSTLSYAKIILSPLYGDGMVLQQQSETTITGYASGKELTVAMAIFCQIMNEWYHETLGLT